MRKQVTGTRGGRRPRLRCCMSSLIHDEWRVVDQGSRRTDSSGGTGRFTGGGGATGEVYTRLSRLLCLRAEQLAKSHKGTKGSDSSIRHGKSTCEISIRHFGASSTALCKTSLEVKVQSATLALSAGQA